MVIELSFCDHLMTVFVFFHGDIVFVIIFSHLSLILNVFSGPGCLSFFVMAFLGDTSWELIYPVDPPSGFIW